MSNTKFGLCLDGRLLLAALINDASIKAIRISRDPAQTGRFLVGKVLEDQRASSSSSQVLKKDPSPGNFTRQLNLRYLEMNDTGRGIDYRITDDPSDEHRISEFPPSEGENEGGVYFFRNALTVLLSNYKDNFIWLSEAKMGYGAGPFLRVEFSGNIQSIFTLKLELGHPYRSSSDEGFIEYVTSIKMEEKVKPPQVIFGYACPPFWKPVEE